MKTEYAGTISIPASSLRKRIVANVEVVGMKTWRIRIKVGIIFIRFAVWIMGIRANINIK